MEKIKGLIDAPFTPFYENGEVNYEPIEAYAKLLFKGSVYQRIFGRGLYADRRRAHETG
mgnify:CR=1 FL=1